MRFSVISVYALCISFCAVLSAQAPQVLELDKNINRPLLVLQKSGADLRYFTEETKDGTVFWIANKGEQPIHFNITWIMEDGRAQIEKEAKGRFHAHEEEDDDGVPPLPIRAHIGPMGRMRLLPPKGVKELLLEDVRIGQDIGPFIELDKSGAQLGQGRAIK
jgi:hypothetical protein